MNNKDAFAELLIQIIDEAIDKEVEELPFDDIQVLASNKDNIMELVEANSELIALAEEKDDILIAATSASEYDELNEKVEELFEKVEELFEQQTALKKDLETVKNPKTDKTVLVAHLSDLFNEIIATIEKM